VLAEDLRLQRLAENLLPLTGPDKHTATMEIPVDLDDLAFDEARAYGETTGLRVDTAACRPTESRVTIPAAVGVEQPCDNAARHAANNSSSVANDDGAVLLEPDDDGPRGSHPPTGQDVTAKYGRKPSHVVVVVLAMSDRPAAVGPSQEGVSHLTTCS
jgi:hypothetical protein